MTDKQGETTKLSLLYDGPVPTVDIIAVENLSERYQDCWTYRPKEGESGKPINWLSHSDFLPDELPRSRIFSFGYQFGEDSTLKALAQSLLEELVKVRTQVDTYKYPFTP
jgi:hypothetical protein